MALQEQIIARMLEIKEALIVDQEVQTIAETHFFIAGVMAYEQMYGTSKEFMNARVFYSYQAICAFSALIRSPALGVLDDRFEDLELIVTHLYYTSKDFFKTCSMELKESKSPGQESV